jgi:uroporphyrin-III C-methyltransferase
MTKIRSEKSRQQAGRVVLVGAGPGAADLITLRGARALREADVILYDDLANAELLELAPTTSEKIYVGKRLGSHSATQQRICSLLVEKAREGSTVVRLKGGDPMVFGRAGEEIQVLMEAGIPFEIVPGITAATAMSASAEIPLTQRGVTSTLVFATGHPCGAPGTQLVDWRALAKLNATLCIYMGTQRFAEIATELIAGGLSPDTPVAVMAGATLSSETLRVGTLADGDRLTVDPRRRAALIVVGEVVRWREGVRAAAADAHLRACEI